MGADPVGAADDFTYVGYRRKLIEDIRQRGIADLEILQLFDRVPRHLFLPEGVLPRAYEDSALPIGWGQTASQPSLQAFTLSVLQPRRDETVLELGTGSGFLTALLALLADRVYSIERVRQLSVRARAALDALRIHNAALLVGDGTIGWRKYAPFDVIVVSAAAPDVPTTLLDQLADPGRMLLPVGSRESQELVLVKKESGTVTQSVVRSDCSFVPLLGRFAWSSEERG